MTPDWINEEFLENIVKRNEALETDKIHILKYNITNNLPKGSNYLSEIYTVDIDYKIISKNNLADISECEKKLSLIFKVPLTIGQFVSTAELGIVEKEIEVYKDLLPKINAILQNQNDCDYVSAKMYENDLHNILILENLNASGYKMADRKKQLDFEHAIILLKQLAKFHAASVQLYESEPHIIDRVGKDLIHGKSGEENQVIKDMASSAFGSKQIDSICNEFERWPETRKFVNFLKKLTPKVWELLQELFRPKDGEFIAVSHGDLWINNFLFKYDSNGKPCSAKFVDFQLLRHTNPAIDILLFFYTSIQYEVLKTHYDDFIKIYLDNLNMNLKKYGSLKHLNEVDFRKSVKQRELYGLIQCLILLPIVLGEFSENDDVQKNDQTRPNFNTNKAFRSLCARHLEDFSKLEWFQNFE